ncbi:VacJ family lipoprotein [Aquicoccus sp. G2-2]|uniref:MlaA family lipoprotein n=1 Tax=Aquicoccus sp. G2-2 TaxID=3092120 RepID=UPI002AE049F1|nr:VacJ family lipoprotein [Aquicoccus sp. G2-2]MEA1115126.1 VacJ family lipoprotein [Aquicoccus sp. G2-2]
MRLRPRAFGAAGLVLLVTLAACSTPGPGQAPDGIFDPYEQTNRSNHELNLALDKALIRPTGKGVSSFLPDPIEDSVGYFASNLSLPSTIVNNLLQGDLGGALKNTLRFAVNTTVGFGGLADPAGEFGIYEKKADFGQTLAVWGVPEGAYVELPVLGPSTERDAAGKVVDLFTNPLSYVLDSPEKYVGTVAGLTSKLGDRGRYSETIDSILYESADSYAQARAIYLQNRRYELGEDDGSAYVDPYDDPYGDPYADPDAQ